MASVAILFMPIFIVLFGGFNRTYKLREAERDRRLAMYRRSPESQLLRLN